MTDRGRGIDEVDRITSQWDALGIGVDTKALHVFSRISRIAWHLDAMRREAFAECGLEGWQFDVLSALRRAGDPFELTPGALASDTLVTSGTMTSRIDKLLAQGLVTKHRSRTDGRSVVVRLTPEGLAKADGALATLTSKESALLAALSGTERDALVDALRTILLDVEESPSQ